MAQYINKDALVTKIKERRNKHFNSGGSPSSEYCYEDNEILSIIATLEVEGVDLEKEVDDWYNTKASKEFENVLYKDIEKCAEHFFELGLKVQHDNWKVVDNTNLPQGDRTKIYCVFTKQRYILATVINHPQDEDLLQWKCTEFPFHRYNMCEGDKYIQIV